MLTRVTDTLNVNGVCKRQISAGGFWLAFWGYPKVNESV